MSTKKAVKRARRRPANLNVRDARWILETCNNGFGSLEEKQPDAVKLAFLRIADLANRIQNRSRRADARTGRNERSLPATAGASVKKKRGVK